MTADVLDFPANVPPNVVTQERACEVQALTREADRCRREATSGMRRALRDQVHDAWDQPVSVGFLRAIARGLALLDRQAELHERTVLEARRIAAASETACPDGVVAAGHGTAA